MSPIKRATRAAKCSYEFTKKKITVKKNKQMNLMWARTTCLEVEKSFKISFLEYIANVTLIKGGTDEKLA